MARVVIIVVGGAIQHIMADTQDVEVMVLDYDVEGPNPERVKKYDGEIVYAFSGVDEVNPNLVREIADALFNDSQQGECYG